MPALACGAEPGFQLTTAAEPVEGGVVERVRVTEIPPGDLSIERAIR